MSQLTKASSGELLDNVNQCFSREQLQQVIQGKKISEVEKWFKTHFIESKREEYITRCPIVIFQGPTGCGKSSVLRSISNELNIPIKDYSETSDVTAINFDMKPSVASLDDHRSLSRSIDHRKALKFEKFVTNNLIYDSSQLYRKRASTQTQGQHTNIQKNLTNNNIKHIPSIGVIIHVESSLTFTKHQTIFIQSLCRLLKMIKEINKRSCRRIAIVFETIDGEHETISLPTRFRISMGIQIFKFNSITKANMKKLILEKLNGYNSAITGKTIELLFNDSNGDISACNKILQLICNNPSSSINLQNKINEMSLNRNDDFEDPTEPVQKKQKMDHINLVFSSNFMRGTTRSCSFFHVLGKIFYQKRLYPILKSEADIRQYNTISPLDRPFPLENSTNDLLRLIHVEPDNLIPWLHQHYYKFCNESNIFKAAQFLENISLVDTMSISPTQTSQFYEHHHIIDQLQVYVAIESTVFSLYEKQNSQNLYLHPNLSRKKALIDPDVKTVVKSSVENFCEPSHSLYSFNKPILMSMFNLVAAYKKLLNLYSTNFHSFGVSHINCDKILVDYIPYMKIMSENWLAMSPEGRKDYYPPTSLYTPTYTPMDIPMDTPRNNHPNSHPIFDNEIINGAMFKLECLDDNGIDLDSAESKREKLKETIERMEWLIELERVETSMD